MPVPTVAVAMPMRTHPEPETQWVLDHHLPPGTTILTEAGKSVDEARNLLTARLRALDPRPDVTLWIDADAWFESDFVERFVARVLTCDDRTLVGTVHGTRQEFSTVDVWAKNEKSTTLFVTTPMKVPSDTIPSDQLLEVDGLSAHMLGHRTGLLDHLPEAPWSLDTSVLDEHFDDPVDHLLACRYRLETSEDLAFSRRVSGVGRCVLDCSAFVGHVEGRYMFVPGKSAYVFLDHVPVQMRQEGYVGRAPHFRYGQYGRGMEAAQFGFVRVFFEVLDSPGGVDRLIEKLSAPDLVLGDIDALALRHLKQNRAQWSRFADYYRHDLGEAWPEKLVDRMRAGLATGRAA